MQTEQDFSNFDLSVHLVQLPVQPNETTLDCILSIPKIEACWPRSHEWWCQRYPTRFRTACFETVAHRIKISFLSVGLPAYIPRFSVHTHSGKTIALADPKRLTSIETTQIAQTLIN
jgi:hypothetical protein